MVNSDFTFVFWFVLVIFTLAAAIQATFVLSNVIRLRNVRLGWKTGKLQGYPLFSSMFLLVTLATIMIAFSRGELQELIAAGFSGWLGICWFTTSHFSTKRYITDHGIVKNVNEPAQTVAWHQIRDFVEKTHGSHTQYVFIYTPDVDKTPKELIRLELQVPERREKEFRKLISHKLGRRIRCYAGEDIDVQAFNK